MKIIPFDTMTDNKENQNKPEQTSECSSEKKSEAASKSDKRKARLKFKKEDMYEIKYNF